MPFHSQSQSSFVTRLPREVREAIYLEIWRSVGMRQHLVTHARYHLKVGALTEVHLARWPCTTEFHVGNRLQDEVDALPIEMFNPAGRLANSIPYQRRGRSEWLDHWACEERFFECVVEPWDSENCVKVEEFDDYECWCDVKKQMAAKRQDASALGSYMAMLLTCKLMYVNTATSLHSI